ncbi:hypothetical protein [Streptomyces sp. NPDC058142]|uniref:hypothetical protein n=1 Tax=Streptomyces sp. NPDC058142 TaxID=3346355 RepID=UPI0036F12F95
MTAARVTLLVGVLTASVAFFGYLLDKAAKRRDVEATHYATGLKAVKEFEELPYRISRRSTSDGPTRTELGERMSDIYVRIEFYRLWTIIHSSVVGECYAILVDRDHELVREQIKDAWASPVITIDSQNHLDGKFNLDNVDEWNLCIDVMKRELSLWSPFLRLGTRRRIKQWHDRHPPSGPNL